MKTRAPSLGRRRRMEARGAAECAARGGVGTPCTGPATKRCGLCGAVAYCTADHQVSPSPHHPPPCSDRIASSDFVCCCILGCDFPCHLSIWCSSRLNLLIGSIFPVWEFDVPWWVMLNWRWGVFSVWRCFSRIILIVLVSKSSFFYVLLHLFGGLFMYNLVIHMVIGTSLPPPTVNGVIGLLKLQLLSLSFLGIWYTMMGPYWTENVVVFKR